MGKSKTNRTRKQRRGVKAVLRFGSAARPVHKSPSGRTGSVHAKKLRSRRKPSAGDTDQ